MTPDIHDGMAVQLWDGTKGTLRKEPTGWRIDWQAGTGAQERPSHYDEWEIFRRFERGSLLPG